MKAPSKYPLAWPSRWPRAKVRTGSAFKTNFQYSKGDAVYSYERIVAELENELRRLGAEQPIVSSNLRGYRIPTDTGVAVYFKLKGKQVAFACDKWDRVECNVWAITKHIEALRGQERWGIGTVEQAFTGYFQLPEPMVLRPWHVILAVEEDCTYAEAQASYRRLAKRYHPDNGGTDESMSALNNAYDEAKRIMASRNHN